LPAASSSSIANDAVEAYDHISPADLDITAPEIQNNIPGASKTRTKQKNTTTVRL
jgi:hypothetical protein